jgi:hypothetical protein
MSHKNGSMNSQHANKNVVSFMHIYIHVYQTVSVQKLLAYITYPINYTEGQD